MLCALEEKISREDSNGSFGDLKKINSLLQLIMATSLAGGFDRTPSFTSSNR